MKKFKQLQENSERKFNELRNKIDKWKEFFTKENKIIFKIMALKNSINEMKHEIESTCSWEDQMEDMISYLKDRNM